MYNTGLHDYRCRITRVKLLGRGRDAMTTTEKDVLQPCQAAASELARSAFEGQRCGPSRGAQSTSSATEGNQRLSIFGGWCRLLVCLALLAAAQHYVPYLRSSSAPASQLPLVQHPTAQPEAPAAALFMVDVNRAPQHELEALPEVGVSLATRIVDYRQARGPFRQIDDLLQVRGIGPRTLEQLRSMLLVRPPEGPVEY